MDKNGFLDALRKEIKTLRAAVSTQNGDWTIKGFIDIAKNIYTISTDTKVISKVMELSLFPELLQFAKKYDLEMILAAQQNFYPDISFRDREKNIFALDLKSTYRVGENHVNGMTLGTFTGYFRARKSTRNITFPYESYKGHFVLGIVYSKKESSVDERRKYSLNEIGNITSVIENLEFFVQEKYCIASDKPGSGNTRNIGSVTEIDKLISGSGPFSSHGEAVFDDYWMGYLTGDMARAAGVDQPPYNDLESYLKYKSSSK
jgi:hypothetical protein